MKLLPTITTTSGSDWKARIKEIKDLNLAEVALFLTCLEEDGRKELYSLILKSPIKRIPFVHLKSDMKLSELDYLIKKYDTQVFNTHSAREFPIPEEWEKYRNIICIENAAVFLDEDEVKKWGGLCLDFSHLENAQLLDKEKYENDIKIIDKYPIRCNHISAIKPKFLLDEHGQMHYASHILNDRSELDYLKKYPLEYFSDFCALELENKITDQLAAIDYVNNLLKGRDTMIKGMGF